MCTTAEFETGGGAHVDADVALDLAAGLAVCQHIQQRRLQVDNIKVATCPHDDNSHMVAAWSCKHRSSAQVAQLSEVQV